MQHIIVILPSDGTMYIPVPSRGTLKGMRAIYQTDVVEPNDTLIASRATTAVNTLTAVNTAGLVVETGVPDVTNKGLIFDPGSATATDHVIKLVANGAAGVAVVDLEYDDSAYVEQSASES